MSEVKSYPEKASGSFARFFYESLFRTGFWPHCLPESHQSVQTSPPPRSLSGAPASFPWSIASSKAGPQPRELLLSPGLPSSQADCELPPGRGKTPSPLGFAKMYLPRLTRCVSDEATQGRLDQEMRQVAARASGLSCSRAAPPSIFVSQFYSFC